MTAIDTTVPSLTIVKTFTYRGEAEEWSNTYFFTGPTPSTDANWKLLADTVIAEEKTLYDSDVVVVRAVGHEAGESVAVWEYDYAAHSETVPGTLALASDTRRQGGDSACWIRYTTTQKTSKGKPIYLRNYYHPAYAESAAVDGTDQVSTNWITAAEAFGTTWLNGTYVIDGDARTKAGPHGAVAQSRQVSEFVTTRTLERRGKRPPTSP